MCRLYVGRQGVVVMVRSIIHACYSIEKGLAMVSRPLAFLIATLPFLSFFKLQELATVPLSVVPLIASVPLCVGFRIERRCRWFAALYHSSTQPFPSIRIQTGKSLR